ncbi:MAG: hypothetical protein H0T73_18080 [Ardenticatenales bacterium]|nr:hypothetical protein [Ardenticatenales bacterium]
MQAPSRTISWPIVFISLGILVVALGLCAACLSLSIAFDTEVPSSTSQSYLFCFVLIALPMIVSGAASLWYGVRQRAQEKAKQLQRFILDLASKNNGAVTATELALHSTMPLDQAQDYLDTLAARGVCRMELAENGTTCFVFEHPGSLNDGGGSGGAKTHE